MASKTLFSGPGLYRIMQGKSTMDNGEAARVFLTISGVYAAQRVYGWLIGALLFQHLGGVKKASGYCRILIAEHGTYHYVTECTSSLTIGMNA